MFRIKRFLFKDLDFEFGVWDLRFGVCRVEGTGLAVEF